MVVKGSCSVACKSVSEPTPRYNCVDGVVTLDPETPPCKPLGDWEVTHGACSVTCGTGIQPTLVRCSTGFEEDCDLSSQ